MLFNEIHANTQTEKLFRDVPGLKYLPLAAAERGMYGSFIQGQANLYFVFGYDEELIHRGVFCDYDNHLYAADELAAERRIQIHDSNVIRRRFNARMLVYGSVSSDDVRDAIACMNNLEKVTTLFRIFHREPTEYFDCSPDFLRTTAMYYQSISAAKTRKEASDLIDAFSYRFSSYCLNYDNPRPEDKNVTLNDYMLSPYCVDKRPEDIERAFRNPKKWEEHMFNYTRDYADNANLTASYIPVYFTDDVERLMKLHHIPYRFVKKDSITSKLQKKLSVTAGADTRVYSNESVVLVYPSTYVLFMNFLLRWACIDKNFDEESQNFALKLCESGTYYGFTIALDQHIIDLLYKYNVKFGAVPIMQNRFLAGENQIYCIAPLEQKPLIDAVIFEYCAEKTFLHSQSAALTVAECEYRYPKFEGGHTIQYRKFGDSYNTTRYMTDESLKEFGVLTDECCTNDSYFSHVLG